VRDKLPRGHYVVVATLMDRLGGKPITYSGSQEVRVCERERGERERESVCVCARERVCVRERARELMDRLGGKPITYSGSQEVLLFFFVITLKPRVE